MKVKELIEKLLKCDPEAEINIEDLNGSDGPEISVISLPGPLDRFLEEEVPFRLIEILGVSEEDAEKVKDEILDGLCVSRGGNFDFFDYDAFDSFIENVLDENGITYEGVIQ